MFRPLPATRLTYDEVMSEVREYGCHGAHIVGGDGNFVIDLALRWPLSPMRYEGDFASEYDAIVWWRIWCADQPHLAEVELYIGGSTLMEWLAERNQEVTFS